jgi:hypothetical protein
MSDPKSGAKFDETLRRLIKQKPKPHDEMKKGREPKNETKKKPR